LSPAPSDVYNFAWHSILSQGANRLISRQFTPLCRQQITKRFNNIFLLLGLLREVIEIPSSKIYKLTRYMYNGSQARRRIIKLTTRYYIKLIKRPSRSTLKSRIYDITVRFNFQTSNDRRFLSLARLPRSSGRGRVSRLLAVT